MENIDKENMDFYCNRIINNSSILISNSKIWTFFLDNKLRDFVIEYNFNFADIANRFQEFIAYPYKYDFTEEEIRKHWAFLHSCRYFNRDIDEDFYDSHKANYNQLAEEEENLIIQEKIDFEKELKEQEKLRREEEQKRINENNIKEKKNKINKEELLYNNNGKRKENENNKDKTNIDNKEEEVDTNINKNIKIHQEIKKDSLTINNNKNNNTNYNIVNNPDTSLIFKDKKDLTDEIISSKGNSEIKKIIQNEKEKQNLAAEIEFNNEDIINALFKKANEIKLDYGDRNLTVSGKDYILPELDNKAWDDFPNDFKILPDHGLTEEDKIKKREEMLKEFKEEEIRKKKLLRNDKCNNIDSINDINDKKNEMLEVYFNINQKSMKFFKSKIEGDLDIEEKIGKIIYIY